MLIKFNEPYNLYVVKDSVTAIKQVGAHVHLWLACGNTCKISTNDYSLEEVIAMYNAEAQAPAQTPKRNGGKKRLTND